MFCTKYAKHITQRGGEPDCTRGPHPKIKKLGAGRNKLFFDLRKKIVTGQTTLLHVVCHVKTFFCLFTSFFGVYPMLIFSWWTCISVIIPWLLIKRKRTNLIKEVDMVLPNHTRAALKYLAGRIWPAGRRFPTTDIMH